MIETFGISEIKNVSSPLEELSKNFDILPEEELNKSFENSDREEGKEECARKIKTIRDDLEGQKHPETGVPYERKVVVTDTGELVEGVFPQFDSKFDAQLPKELEQASDAKQFEESNRQLKEWFDKDPEFRKQFDERQQDMIKEGDTPYGYTWHHNEEVGKMQLVDYETHSNSRHTGGKFIWGGGRENR